MKSLPQTEDRLNSHAISSLRDLVPYAKRQELAITRRMVKMLVKSPANHVTELLDVLADAELTHVARAIVDTNPRLA